MYPQLSVGDTAEFSIIDGDVIETVSVRLVRRVRASDLVSEIRRTAQPSIRTDGLPQRCRWYGRSERLKLYLCEMAPRIVTWRFQPYLDAEQRIQIPVALPYQIYLIATDPSDLYFTHAAYWSARPLPTGSAIAQATLLQYGAPNVQPMTGNACLGGGGPGRLAGAYGIDALLREMHQSLGEDRNGTDLSGSNILTFLPANWTTEPWPDDQPELFGIPADRRPLMHPCLSYATQLGLWTRRQTDPLRAVCDLAWPAIATVKSAVTAVAPELFV